MSGATGIDDLINEYMHGDDARADDSTSAPSATQIDFDALFADADNHRWWSQPPALHVPEALSAVAGGKDSNSDDDSDDDSDDNSDDDSDDDMHDDSDDESVHDQDDRKDAGVHEQQAYPRTSKKQSPSYRVSLEELHKRLKWSDKFKSCRRYLQLKDLQKQKIQKLQKNGRKFKQGLMSAMMKAERGGKDRLDALMYQKKIGWRKRSKAQNERGMQWVCAQIVSIGEYDGYFEKSV